jgi:hypothetical protein
MHSEDLIGTWELESCIAKGSSGAQVFPYGESPRGFLTYTASGHMAAVIMRSGRTKFASRDVRGGTPEEIKEAFDGFDAYAGLFTFDEKTGTVTHSAEVSRLPNWEGTAQLRYAKLFDGHLHLDTPPVLAEGQEWVVSLAWRRAAVR